MCTHVHAHTHGHTQGHITEEETYESWGSGETWFPYYPFYTGEIRSKDVVCVWGCGVSLDKYDSLPQTWHLTDHVVPSDSFRSLPLPTVSSMTRLDFPPVLCAQAGSSNTAHSLWHVLGKRPGVVPSLPLTSPTPLEPHSSFPGFTLSFSTCLDYHPSLCFFTRAGVQVVPPPQPSLQGPAPPRLPALLMCAKAPGTLLPQS